jgi:hypothetical protein
MVLDDIIEELVKEKPAIMKIHAYSFVHQHSIF